MDIGTRSPLCTILCPGASVVVLAKKDFSCPGATGVYGKRVWRREGKLATIWLGGRALFWIGAGHETLVMSGGLTASLRGLLRGWKLLSGQQGMACLVTPFY